MSFKFKDMFLSIIIFIVLFVSDDSLLFGTNSNNLFIFMKFPIYALLAILLMSYCNFNKIKLNVKIIELFLIMSLLIILTCLVNLDFKFGYIYRILSLFLGVLLIHSVRFDYFTHIFLKIFKFICLFSLGVYLIELFSPSLLSKFPILTNSAGNAYFNLFLTVVPVENWGVPRNYGIFREPGVFVIFIVFSLMLELFYKKNSSLLNQTIFLLTLITTKSTTGFIVLIFIYFMVFTSKVQNRNQLIKKIIFLILGLAISYYLIYHTELIFSENQYKSVFNKFNNETDTVARYASLTINFLIFMNSPFLGVGISNLTEVFPQLTAQYYGIYSEHNTNTTLIQFSTFGLFFGIIWLFCLYKTTRLFSNNKFVSLVVFISLQVLFVGENISNNLFLSVLTFYGIYEMFSKKDQLNYTGGNHEKNYADTPFWRYRWGRS
ncbi:O-antigen ligase family protein [Enterococcus gallinarum]|uniref:O-antigen ligase family protein n=1 Tax=Enterococcus gallinarum TaxID=1353 RepID=UPI00288DBA39|nr:O-antigen ligase family protein [Enterococcus gallinarum]MDT2719659.1 O-antigen ligase family protein [Enterococcus gallinarum]